MAGSSENRNLGRNGENNRNCRRRRREQREEGDNVSTIIRQYVLKQLKYY
jgi:hypothetical protein